MFIGREQKHTFYRRQMDEHIFAKVSPSKNIFLV